MVWFQNYEKNLQLYNIAVKIFSKIIFKSVKCVFECLVSEVFSLKIFNCSIKLIVNQSLLLKSFKNPILSSSYKEWRLTKIDAIEDIIPASIR